MRRMMTMAAVAAICAALATAPSMATGKTFKYAGPIDLVKLPSVFPWPDPAIELKLTFDGKTPKAIPAGTLKEEGLYGYCTDGTGPLYYATKIGKTLGVKKRRFSGSFEGLTVTGRVNKRSITGTVRFRLHIPAVTDPGFEAPAKDCDSGVQTWSARR